MICDKCDGKGITLIHNRERECNKCYGTGKLDWIENVFGKDLEKISPLDKVNVRRLTDYVKKSIEDVLENDIVGIKNNLTDFIKLKIRKILDPLINNGTIFEYDIVVDDFEKLTSVFLRIRPYDIESILITFKQI